MQINILSETKKYLEFCKNFDLEQVKNYQLEWIQYFHPYRSHTKKYERKITQCRLIKKCII